MLKNQQIIGLGFPKWEGDYMKSTVHLMQQFAKNNEVLYVDYPFSILDYAKGLLGKKYVPVNQIAGWKKRLKTMHKYPNGSLHLLRLPPILPINWLNSEKVYQKMTQINAYFVLPYIRSAMHELGFVNPIIINAFLPGLGRPLAGKLNEKLLVYYCYDEISKAPWVGKHGGDQEYQYLEKVDLVVTTSDHLQQEKSTYNSNCVVVKNGVDLNCFATEDYLPVPTLKSEDYPSIIGYLGSVDERLDYCLLEQVIQQFPKSRFVFVGRKIAEAAVKKLDTYPNTLFLGAQPVTHLAGYLEQFDVGLIPFQKNELTAAIYPLKINEYLARGKAVVSTDFVDLSEFENTIAVADNYHDFAKAITVGLVEENTRMIDLRKAMAAQNTWTNRSAEFGEYLHRSLASKKRNNKPKKRIS